MSNDQIKFADIGERVMRELNRRLATPELAEDLPGTLLMKVAMDYVKHLEEKNRIEEAKLNQEKLDPLEIIDQPGLSTSIRVEILAEYLDDLETHWRKASERMADLLKEVENGSNESVLSELQDVVPEE